LFLLSSLGRSDADSTALRGFVALLAKPVKQSRLHDAFLDLWVGDGHTPREATKRTSEFDREMADRTPLSILLVEDNAVNQQLAVRFLGRMGYSADVAANGVEAVDAVRRRSYDVVLMDVE